MGAYYCTSFNGCTTKLIKAMKEILKLNLVDSGIPGFVLKRNIIGKELVVDKRGNILEKNV